MNKAIYRQHDTLTIYGNYLGAETVIVILLFVINEYIYRWHTCELCKAIGCVYCDSKLMNIDEIFDIKHTEESIKISKYDKHL